MPVRIIRGQDEQIVKDWNGGSSVLIIENKNSSEEKSSVLRDNLPPPPDRNTFRSQDEYEEATAYYNSRVGRIRKLVERARADKASKDK